MPNAGLAVGAAAGMLCSGQSTAITVGSTELGISYQLRNSAGNVNVGNPAAGTGATIDLPTGTLTSTTTFNVLATRSVGGCSVQLAQTRTITVNPLPDAGLAVGATQTQIEVGQSANVTVANSQTGVNYQLRRNEDNSNVGGPVAGTGADGAYTFANIPAGTYSIVASKAGYQTHTWYYEVLTPGGSTAVPDHLLPRSSSKIGAHVVLGNRTGWGGFIGDAAFVADMGWYDDMCRQDDYVFGIASWTLGNWGGANWFTALPEMADYICAH